jgi:hypothetical protein
MLNYPNAEQRHTGCRLRGVCNKTVPLELSLQQICCGQELYDRLSTGSAKLDRIDHANTHLYTLPVKGWAVDLNAAFITLVYKHSTGNYTVQDGSAAIVVLPAS